MVKSSTPNPLKERAFVITVEPELIDPPSWLEKFREKYDTGHNYHISLKYPTITKLTNIKKIHKSMRRISHNYQKFTIRFSEVRSDSTSKGNLVMIFCKDRANDVFELQREVLNRFENFGEVIRDNYENFEKNFSPHITIGRHLSEEAKVEALQTLPEKVSIEGLVSNLILTVVEETKMEQLYDEENRYIYTLQGKEG
jgi:2'-5' RNA ligase